MSVLYSPSAVGSQYGSGFGSCGTLDTFDTAPIRSGMAGDYIGPSVPTLMTSRSSTPAYKAFYTIDPNNHHPVAGNFDYSINIYNLIDPGFFWFDLLLFDAACNLLFSQSAGPMNTSGLKTGTFTVNPWPANTAWLTLAFKMRATVPAVHGGLRPIQMTWDVDATQPVDSLLAPFDGKLDRRGVSPSSLADRATVAPLSDSTTPSSLADRATVAPLSDIVVPSSRGDRVGVS